MVEHDMAYRLSTQRPPDNFSDELYQRFKSDVDEVSARAAARLADKQGGEYAVALEGAWKSFQLYIKLANFVFKYLDRFHIYRRNLPEIKIVAHHSFGNALSAQAALRWPPRHRAAGRPRRVEGDGRAAEDSRPGAWNGLASTTQMTPVGPMSPLSSGPCPKQSRSFEAKWQFCLAAAA